MGDQLRQETPITPAATPAARRDVGRVELIALLAGSMALTALGIDLMLPAFGAIRADMGLAPDSNVVAGLVTAYFLGLSAGQPLYGPIADRFGRRSALFLGYGIYCIGALAATVFPTFASIMVARFVWGFGAAGSRVVTLAIVRDRWQGEQMARAMSFIMGVFILVPIVAPSVGAGIVAVTSWRLAFALCMIIALLVWAWAARRLPESLTEDDRRELRFRTVLAAVRVVVTHRQTMAYTLAMTFVFGAVVSYLGSSQVIYAEVFDAEHLFPLLFGGMAALMSAAMFANARFVERIGTRRFAHWALLWYLVAGVGLAFIALTSAGRPPLWLFMVGLAGVLVGMAFLLPNLNTIAMHPMGSIAGTASSVVGAAQTSIGALLGAGLDRAFDGTVGPLALGFLGSGVLAISVVLWGESGRLFLPLDAVPEPTPAATGVQAS